jgi:uncharacterized membrane protein
MFEKIVFEILYYVIWIIEIVGISIVVFGTFNSVFKMFQDKFKDIKTKKKKGESVKLVLAKYLALGLEFMMAAEILKTVTINREFTEIMILGAIVILRAAMSLLIYWELSYEEKKETLIEKKNKNTVKPL